MADWQCLQLLPEPGWEASPSRPCVASAEGQRGLSHLPSSYCHGNGSHTRPPPGRGDSSLPTPLLAKLSSHVDKTRGQKTPLTSDSFLTPLPNTTPFYVTHTNLLLLLGWWLCRTKADRPHQLALHLQQRLRKPPSSPSSPLAGVRAGLQTMCSPTPTPRAFLQ